jgi:hypothetical protein
LIQVQDPLENAELLAFTKAVESRSLSRAAVELGMPRATLSRRLARLAASRSPTPAKHCIAMHASFSKPSEKPKRASDGATTPFAEISACRFLP